MLSQKDFDVERLGVPEIQTPVPPADWLPENAGVAYPTDCSPRAGGYASGAGDSAAPSGNSTACAATRATICATSSGSPRSAAL